MSDHATTRVVDDEAPTMIDHGARPVVDPVRRETRPRTVGAELRPPARIKRWCWALCASSAVLLIGVVFGALVRQRSVSAKLRRELVRLERDCEACRTNATMGAETVTSTLTSRAPRPTELATLSRTELERRGVAALIDGNYDAALVYYRMISERSPENAVLSDFVSVLRAKSRCDLAISGETIACR